MPKSRARRKKPETVLSKLRRQFGQARLAAMVGVSQQTYSKYESGQLVPDSATQATIARFFNVPVRRIWPKANGRPKEVQP